MIEAVKLTIIFFWKQEISSKQSNKGRSKKCYVLIKKMHIKVKTFIIPMNFVEHLRKSNVSENSKVYYGRLLRYRLYERYCYINKSRWDVQCLLATVYWSIDEDGTGFSKFLLESALECQYVYYARPLLRGRLHLGRDAAAEKEFDIAI